MMQISLYFSVTLWVCVCIGAVEILFHLLCFSSDAARACHVCLCWYCPWCCNAQPTNFTLKVIRTPGHVYTTFCSGLSDLLVLVLPLAGGEGGSVGVQQSFLAVTTQPACKLS
jgi:hypothetical protein